MPPGYTDASHTGHHQRAENSDRGAFVASNEDSDLNASDQAIFGTVWLGRFKGDLLRAMKAAGYFRVRR
jgi:hypothetical protein